MHDDDKQLLSDFLAQLTIEKRASQYTVKSYKRDLNCLSTYCESKSISLWTDLKQTDIRSYMASRHRQGLSSTSLQRELSAIRSFFNFLLKNQLTDNNPGQYIKAPKKTRKLPKTLDVDQIKSLLEAGTNSTIEIRDLAMFELFYSSGIRLSELAQLNLTDIDLTDKSLMVRSGKGGKSRMLPIGSKAVVAINTWLEHRIKSITSTETALFISTRGTRLGQRSIELRLKQWCKKKGDCRTYSSTYATTFFCHSSARV